LCFISSESEAFEAFTKFNARWYGGKQMTAQFINIPSWKRAICGNYKLLTLVNVSCLQSL